MMIPAPDDRVRLLPAGDMLKIILKNTFFEDGLLDEARKIRLVVGNAGGTPVLQFRFSNPGYDLDLPLLREELAPAERGWLHQPHVVIQLQLSETIVADRIAKRNFVLNKTESEAVKQALSN